ncbi:MAG: DUF2911 domain-containing protein [Bacteroidota bacterium]|nr:DUF2911 domain-containing protein [Bacteroidota bacterium]
MKQVILSLMAGLLIIACQPGSTDSKASNTYYLVTKLGNDTLAIERISKSGRQLEADVVLRSPRISLTSYSIEWDDSNRLIAMEATTYEDDFSNSEQGRVVQEISASGDSLKITAQGRNGAVTYSMANDGTYLPFIDMVHWPYDIAFNRANNSAADSIHQYLLTGRRASDFIIHRTQPNNYTLRHPSRGVMYVKTNASGDLIELDAKETTRKLIVERVAELDFDALTKRYLAIDEKGSPFGTLSPAREAEFSFGGSDFKVTYGSPQKRGREIFGGIVPYGKVWRTGANAASHFSTSKDLYINGQKIPAGEYTLFSIPEEEGGTLIINQQTGQNGQAYDQSRDLMRVPMQRENSAETIEDFTIQVVETKDGGSLELLWDRTIYFVNFTFR